MNTETLWNNIELLRGAFPLGTDSVVCSDFARFPKNARVADLGCGSGAISLMLLASQADLQVTGIELEPAAVSLAEENRRHNHLEQNFQVIAGDLRAIKDLLPAGSMDGAISNPPYFPVGSGQVSTLLTRARSEETCTLSQLVEAAGWLLRWGGRFVLVHRPERLADLICALREQRLEPKRIRFVRHQPDKDVNLVLMEARKGGKPGLAYEKDLILFTADGRETEEYKRIYHRK